MMKMEVRTFRVPGWLMPVLLLAALALVPFALMLALAVACAAIGISLLRSFLPPGDASVTTPPAFDRKDARGFFEKPAIDAEYVVKEKNEKN
jgi:hypothetical protein